MTPNALNSTILEFAANPVGQITPLLQEFLDQQFYFYWIVFFLYLLAVVTLIFLYKRLYKQGEEILDYWLPLLFLFLMPLFGLIYVSKILIEIKLTPKIYLIQKAEEIIKK